MLNREKKDNTLRNLGIGATGLTGLAGLGYLARKGKLKIPKSNMPLPATSSSPIDNIPNVKPNVKPRGRTVKAKRGRNNIPTPVPEIPKPQLALPPAQSRPRRKNNVTNTVVDRVLTTPVSNQQINQIARNRSRRNLLTVKNAIETSGRKYQKVGDVAGSLSNINMFNPNTQGIKQGVGRNKRYKVRGFADQLEPLARRNSRVFRNRVGQSVDINRDLASDYFIKTNLYRNRNRGYGNYQGQDYYRGNINEFRNKLLNKKQKIQNV